MNAFRRLWARFSRVQAPLPTPAVFAPVTKLSQEQFSEAGVAKSVRQDERTTFLASRIIAINNANVVRNYGTHIEDRSYAVKQLDAEEQADIDRYIEPKYAKAAGVSE